MTIACLSAFYPYRGGIAQFSASLYRALEKEHHVKAYTFTRQYPGFLFPGKTQLVAGDDKADKIPAGRVLDTLNPFTWTSAARKIVSSGPDLFLGMYWMSYFAPSMGTVSRLVRKKAKVITLLHNVIPHEKRFFDEAFTRYFLKQSDGFVVMTESVKNDLLRFVPGAKYIHHPHPLYDHFGSRVSAEEARERLGIPSGKKVLLFFGFIRDYKGLDILLDAMAKLNEEYVLVIAGEVYGSFEKYTRQIEQLHLQDRVIQHIRYIGDEEVPLFFSAAEVCILPYRSATQSGITSIAYHFEVPLIATDTGGLKETIPPGRAGIIIDKPDAAPLAEAIAGYFSQNRKPALQEGIRSLKDELSWKRMAGAIAEFGGRI